MSETIRWGILGTGFVACEFATGLSFLADAQLHAVASRMPNNAKKFANQFKVPRVYESYEELVKDPEVDVIYIATPHSKHKEHCLLALEAGKPILCEKPFALNAQEAKEIIDYARQKQLFCMEAMWMLFMPLIQKVKTIVDHGEIGEVKMLTADFGNAVEYDLKSRFFNLQLGGGALLDRGVYCLALADYLLGTPSQIATQASFGESGVDEQSSILLNYPQGELAILFQSLRTYTSNQAVVMGTKGKITIGELFIKPSQISITQFTTTSYSASWSAPSLKQKIISKVKQNRLVQRLYLSLGDVLKSEQKIIQPPEGNGYNHEAAEVMNCLKNGQLESKIMPLDRTLSIMETVDKIRDRWQ